MAREDVRQPTPSNWSALVVLLLGAFLPVLDFNVVNLALPAIRADLHATSAELQFVMNAYSCTYGVLLITGGRLGDRFGRRQMFMLGLTGFITASALCGVAETATWLIAGRILQAAAATIMAPQVIASIRTLFPEHQLRRALAFYGATFGLAFITGQVLGGMLVQMRPFGLSWQPIFLINIPVGLLALGGAFFVLRNSHEARPPKLDLGGVLLSSVALFSLIFPLTAGRQDGWPWWSLTLIGGVPLLTFAFLKWERRVERRGGDPLVRIALFHRPSMAFGVPIAIGFYTTSATFLAIAVFLQNGEHVGSAAAGLTLVPLSIAYLIVALISPSLLAHFGPVILAAALGVKVLGMLVLALAVLHSSSLGMAVGLALMGCGYGILMPTIVGAVVRGVEPEHAGLASGIVMSALQVGAAVGVATIGGVFFCLLGTAVDAASYRHAFVVATLANALIIAGAAALAVMFARSQQRKSSAVT